MILQIVSIGPGNPELLNEKTINTLRSAGSLFLRTGRHALSAWLKSEQISFHTMDDLYESSENFDSLSDAIARRLWDFAAHDNHTVYAVSDTMTDRTIDAVFSCRPEIGQIHIVPGFSYADYYLPSCRSFFPTSDVRICSASSFSESYYDPSRPLLLTELNDAITAGLIKNYLSYFIRDEETVIFLDGNAASYPIPLYELDRQPSYNHLSAVAAGIYSYEQRSRRTMEDLMAIMDRLRSADGCPWDRVQTHESLKPYVVEEAWEVVDAIHQGSPDHLAEELGDLLFQVAFHSSIGKSFDEFTIDDVIELICSKMIRRHPHVFGENHSLSGNFCTDSLLSESWDRIKQQETGSKTPFDALDDVSPGLPSLKYAEKTLRKLDRIPGLSAPSVKEITDHIRMICDELSETCSTEDSESKLSALLFYCVQLSHLSGIDSEVLLHQTIRRIVQNCHTFKNNGKINANVLKPLTFNDLGVY